METATRIQKLFCTLENVIVKPEALLELLVACSVTYSFTRSLQ
jgi:hypothetical protein